MNQERTLAEELTFENIAKLGKTLEEHPEEQFRDEVGSVKHALLFKLTALDSVLHPLKDEDFSEKEKEITDFSYSDIVEHYQELSKLAIRVYGPNQPESVLD